MIIDEIQNNIIPISSIPKSTVIEKILLSIRNTFPHFKKAISDPKIHLPLNENKYTQIFVEQLNFQLIKANLNFLAANQYSDIFYNTKGIPDFYFYNLEEGVTTVALFVIECKILPTPLPKIREREYVYGDRIKSTGTKEYNGGIERFKTERHGYNIPQNGLLAFIEKDEYSEWFIKINNWIKDLSTIESSWSIDEQLDSIEITPHYSYAKSSINISLLKKSLLHHFWIKL